MKQFKAESQRLLELMINSIYTNKEIFLRELISNASDAIDKLRFISLTDSAADRDFAIEIEIDEAARTLTVKDNGIGMNEAELEDNLGTIASSGTFKFKNENKTDDELIGQFGVGFYSAFMVAHTVTVISKKYGDDKAYRWSSSGSDGYTIDEAQREQSGSTVILELKQDDEDDKYSEYLSEWRIGELVKKYSDYVRYPIKMLCTTSRKKEGSDEWEECKEVKTLNAMTPIWKRNKGDVKDADYKEFYRATYYDMEEPLHYFRISSEGGLTYDAVVFVPANPPYDYYTSDYKRGLSLYVNGVMIMDKCEELVPEYFGFLRGVVDSCDLSLNISREMLQKDRQLKALAGGLCKKIVAEFKRLMESDRPLYEKIFDKYGVGIKYGVYADFGAKKDLLKDALLFKNADGKYMSLSEYVSQLKDDQKDILYACGKNADAIRQTPQVEGALDKGMQVLFLTDQIDEFVVKVIGEYDGHKIVSVGSAKEQVKDDSFDELIKAIKGRLGEKVKDVSLSDGLGSYPCCISAEGEVSLQMEKILNSMPTGGGVKAQRVLEINPDHPLVKRAKELEGESRNSLIDLLYGEALLLAGQDLDAAEFVKNINKML